MTSHSSVSRAINWSAIDAFGRAGLNFSVLIILARILTPEDFGLIAMLALFVAIGGLLVDGGFSHALIQSQKVTLTDESTVFFLTLMTATLITLVLCASASWIAVFYGQPLLEVMTYWMALDIFLNAFGAIHTTLLSKKLDFKSIAKAGLVASLVSGGVAIFMALQGWGVWSLIVKSLVSTMIIVSMLWLLHPWKPKLVFSLTSVKTLFAFGGFLLWTGFLNVLYNNLYAILIGKLHSVQDVGFYSQAQRLQQLPVNILSNMVGRVLFPVFSAAADDRARLRSVLRKALVSTIFINTPLMLGLIVLAEPLVFVLLGDKWLPSVPILQVLAVVGLMWPLHVLNVIALVAQGCAALNARIELIKLTIAILILLATSPFGILAIAYGQVVASMLAFFINTHYSKQMLNYGWLAQLRDVLPYFFAAIPLIAGVWVVRWTLELPVHFELIVAALIGGGAYLIACKLAKLDGMDNVLKVINRKRI